MKTGEWFKLALILLFVAGLVGCGSDEVEVEKMLVGPKTYIGSEQCKVCHLEHYDS